MRAARRLDGADQLRGREIGRIRVRGEASVLLHNAAARTGGQVGGFLIFWPSHLKLFLCRYLSEFRHVQRGATWKGSRHFCKGRPATMDEIPPCYEGDNWEGVELDQFINCDSNLAANRQTRMLADLELIGK